jgi:hypothetical protein
MRKKYRGGPGGFFPHRPPKKQKARRLLGEEKRPGLSTCVDVLLEVDRARHPQFCREEVVLGHCATSERIQAERQNIGA